MTGRSESPKVGHIELESRRIWQVAAGDADERAADAACLRTELDDWQSAIGLPALDAPVAAGEVPELDDAAREHLRALGYVE